MKKTYLHIFIMMFLTLIQVSSKPCDESVFLNQTEIDNFLINHPDCDSLTSDLVIEQNGGQPIRNLNGLKNIKYIAGPMYIGGTLELIDLEGLNNLEYVGDDLEIFSCPVLEDISALSNLKYVVGIVSIERNFKLLSLKGLENISLDSLVGFQIRDNVLLSDCNIIPVCKTLENSNKIVFISRNGENCFSNTEVEEACSLLSVGNDSNNDLEIVTFDNQTITFNTQIDLDRILFFNYIGKEVSMDIKTTEKTIDVSALSIGIYFIVVNNKSFKVSIQ